MDPVTVSEPKLPSKQKTLVSEIRQCQVKLLLHAIFSTESDIRILVNSIKHEAKVNTCDKKTCSCSYFPGSRTSVLNTAWSLLIRISCAMEKGRKLCVRNR